MQRDEHICESRFGTTDSTVFPCRRGDAFQAPGRPRNTQRGARGAPRQNQFATVAPGSHTAVNSCGGHLPQTACLSASSRRTQLRIWFQLANVWVTSLDDFHNWRLRLSRAPWPFCHSCLREITGSTLVACNAGCTIARNAAPMINTALVPNVRASAWVTP